MSGYPKSIPECKECNNLHNSFCCLLLLPTKRRKVKWKHKKSFKKPFWFVVQCPGQSLFSSQVIIWSRRQIDVVKRFANRYGEGGTNTRAPPPPDTSIMGGQPWLPKLRSCGHFATKLTIIRCQDHTQYRTDANLDLFFLRIIKFCWFWKEGWSKKIFF